MTITLKWLIAHEPQHLFKRAADAFSQKITERTNGAVDVEVLTEAEYTSKYNPEYVGKSWPALVDALSKNEIQMGHTNVHYFAKFDKNFRAFDMPFLFEDHAHAARVFDGEVGKAMTDRLAKTSKLQGLCFTYSGGYRIIGSNDPIISVDELVGKRIRVNSNPLNFDFLTAVGAAPVAQDSYGYDEIIAGDLDASETTYIRFLGKHVLKTEHNMFLTMIVVNHQVWNSFSLELQNAFREVALEVAALERLWSIDDAATFLRDSAANGITVTNLTAADKERLVASSEGIYKEWGKHFAPGLIDAIKAEKS